MKNFEEIKEVLQKNKNELRHCVKITWIIDYVEMV